jgi:short-subunit dehydrogenase
VTGILITGASSGLGEALAYLYAAPGVTLFLSGRDGARVAAVAERCVDLGAEARPRRLDVRNDAAMADWVYSCDREDALNLVIANAGISGGSRYGESARQTRDVFAVNVDGVLNTVLPAIDIMRRRRSGQIALMASLAGYRGMPGAPAYAASKAAVKAWGEGLRGWLADDGVGVTVICPGFVESRMTDANEFRMPFLMATEEAARRMKRGIDANRARVAFPWPMVATVWALAALPPSWVDPVLRKLARKG